MSLFVFLPFRRYRQGHISGRSFETYRLSRSPVNINREEGQAVSITFDHDDWPTENTNSLPLLAAWLKTTHGRSRRVLGEDSRRAYETVLRLSIECQLNSSPQKSANILPDCVSPATSCGGPVRLDRTDLTENGRPVLLTMT
jgi:hypothetical protein